MLAIQVFTYAAQRVKLAECVYEICFLVHSKQKQTHATWASTMRSLSAQATPLHLLLACFSCLVCSLWFVPYLSISHSSCLIQRLALPCGVWHPFFSTPLSLWKTLCPPVLKFRSEGETSWQHFLGLLPLHLDVAKTLSTGRSSPATLDKWSRLCLFCSKQQNWQWQFSVSFWLKHCETVLLFTVFLNIVYLFMMWKCLLDTQSCYLEVFNITLLKYCG